MIKRVTVENGILQGIPAADPRIIAYKGVPFAAPPVGNLRWKAPQPAKNWEGVLNAYTYAPISMQAIPGLNKDDIYTREWNVDPEIPMSEDCLYLNIWTPANSPDEKLPVYVWYFGGGLQVGNTAEMEFDGERIARRGIVFVSVNYRVNVFGFLVHPELTAEDPEKPTNFGNLDQKFGTEWVKRNIAAFGGDPNNITIGGQSAGGGSVLTQVTSPQNKGLFQKAIVESGIMLGAYSNMFGPRRSFKEAEQNGVDFFKFLGVNSLAEARALKAEFIRDKLIEYKGRFGTIPDGKFVVGNSMDLFMSNERQLVPLMMGKTTNEFLAIPPVNTAEEFEKMAREKFGDKADRFLEICKSEAGDVNEMIEKGTFSPIECGIRAVFRKSEEFKNNLDNYYYIFDAEIPGWDNPGTFHSVDLWFFFETLAKCWRPFKGKHYDLARQMCNYWVNFIKTGNPNGPDNDGTPMPEWKPFSTKEPYGMAFGDTCAMETEGPNDLMKFMVENNIK